MANSGPTSGGGFKAVRSFRETVGIIFLVCVPPAIAFSQSIAPATMSREVLLISGALPYALLTLFILVTFYSLRDLLVIAALILMAGSSFLFKINLPDMAHAVMAASLLALLPTLLMRVPHIADISLTRSRLTVIICAAISAGVVWAVSDMSIKITTSAAVLLGVAMLSFAVAGLSRLVFPLLPLGLLVLMAGLILLYPGLSLAGDYSADWGQTLLAIAAGLITLGHRLHVD